MTERPTERVTIDSPRTTAPSLHPWALRAIIIGAILAVVIIVFTVVRLGVGGPADPAAHPLPPRDEILDDTPR